MWPHGEVVVAPIGGVRLMVGAPARWRAWRWGLGPGSQWLWYWSCPLGPPWWGPSPWWLWEKVEGAEVQLQVHLQPWILQHTRGQHQWAEVLGNTSITTCAPGSLRTCIWAPSHQCPPAGKNPTGDTSCPSPPGGVIGVCGGDGLIEEGSGTDPSRRAWYAFCCQTPYSHHVHICTAPSQGH